MDSNTPSHQFFHATPVPDDDPMWSLLAQVQKQRIVNISML
jgi:hypothetical protein